MFPKVLVFGTEKGCYLIKFFYDERDSKAYPLKEFYSLYI